MNMSAEYSDYDYTETSDSEDQYDSESSYGGNARSILSSLDESIIKIDDFLAYERGFVLGDVVSSIGDPSGQLGRVVDVDLTVDLETSFGALIKDVNSKKLERVRFFVVGDYVVHGSWLGKVDRAHDVVTISFNDGAKCEIMVHDLESFIPISPKLFEDTSYPCYPGQRVRIKLPTESKSLKWLSGSWNGSKNEGTICNVEVGLVHVNWIASVMMNCNSFPPSHVQNPKNLILLSCFPHANWQLGDCCILPHEYFENVSPPKLFKLGKDGQYYKQMCVIAKTKSKVDVLWQNGSFSVGLDSKVLFPVNNVGDHDFWPGQLVLEKASEDANSSGPRSGIVKSVDVQDRTVKVEWKDHEGEASEEMVSAYELIEHPDVNYCLGDFVFRTLAHLENSEDKPQSKNYEVLDGSNLLRKEKNHSDGGHLEQFAYLSCIGNVIGFKDGRIEVRWASGLKSKVQPSDIFGLDRLGDFAPIPAITEESVPENVSKEMATHDRKSRLKEEKTAVNDSATSYERDGWGISSFLFPCVSVGYLTSIAKSVFGSSTSTTLLSFFKGTPAFEILKTEEPHLDIDDLEPESSQIKVAAVELNESPTPLIDNEKTELFKQFDIVDDYSDHHFASKESTSPVRRGWLKKVQQDWAILKKDLPESIYVRVYEERIDLLRACIAGAPGTPYHDGLFFFDIFFPSDYPNEPPMVHYNSGGLRLNPNLYDSGKVCLSLLKTWTGSGTEVWDPESSTILQLLLSLQALVLNDKPYFNEAGYDKQMGRAEGEKNSVTYNENAFILSCKSMLYLLRNPPKHFEELVDEHFRQRSHLILMACKSYMNGALVGQPFESERTEDVASKNSCSTGFKIMLAKLLPKLVSGFAEKGIDCSEFLK